MRNNFFAFIPKWLEVKDRAELSVFPLNIMLAAFANIDGVDTMGHVLYQPNFSTFVVVEGVAKMDYISELDCEFRIEISFDLKKEMYCGKKYRGKEWLGESLGSKWNLFFAHLGMLGLVKGEKCIFSPLEK